MKKYTKCIPISNGKDIIIEADSESELYNLIAKVSIGDYSISMSKEDYLFTIHYFMDKKINSYNCAILMMLMMGMRLSEVMNIKCGHIYDDASHVFISENNTNIGRAVYIPSRLQPIILNYANKYDIDIPDNPYIDSDASYFFKENSTGISKPWLINSLHQTYLKLKKDNHLNTIDDLTPTIIRNSFGSYIIEGGADLIQLHHYMGCKSIQRDYETFSDCFYHNNTSIRLPIESIIESLYLSL